MIMSMDGEKSSFNRMMFEIDNLEIIEQTFAG